MRFVKWLFAGTFRAEYDRGYREAVDRILLLPEKVRLGNTLGLDGAHTVDGRSFVGGSPAILMTGSGQTVQRSTFSRSNPAIETRGVGEDRPAL